jgi:hypothetical protein
MTKFIFDAKHNVILIYPSEFPHAEEFEFWCKLLLSSINSSILEYSAGADRHQVRFRLNNYIFNVNYEHYSDSIWCEAEGEAAKCYLPQLYDQFKRHF